MASSVTFWHYLAAPFVFALLGCLWHGLRSIKLPWPDKLTSSRWVDAEFIPGGYTWLDYLHDTDFDEDGYYRFDSWRNARVAVGFTVFFGTLAVVCIPQAAELFAIAVNGIGEWLWSILLRRLENPW